MPYRKAYNNRRGVPAARRPAPAPKPDLKDRISYPEARLEEVRNLYGGTWLAYTNLWTKERQVYKPETAGTFVYAFREGADGKLEDGRSIQLGYGSLSDPQREFSACIASLALTLAQFPELEGRLSIYRVPCVFSSREGWVEVPYFIPEEVWADATDTAPRLKSWHGWRDSYKQRHNIGTIYH